MKNQNPPNSNSKKLKPNNKPKPVKFKKTWNPEKPKSAKEPKPVKFQPKKFKTKQNPGVSAKP